MSFGVWNEPKRNRPLLLSPMIFHLFFVFFFLGKWVRGGHNVIFFFSFFPSTSVRRELHKYVQSCAQLQGERTCKNAASFLLHVHLFFFFFSWVSVFFFTTLGMNVYLTGLNKAGKLVLEPESEKKSNVSQSRLIRNSLPFISVLCHLCSGFVKHPPSGTSKTSTGLCLSLPKLRQAWAWHHHALSPFMIKYQGTPLDILLVQQDGWNG